MNPGDQDQELQKLIDQRIEQKKKEWMNEKKQEIKKEAKQEARKEIRQEIVENVRKETDNENMSRRQFLKKAGLGAAGLGALGLAPAAGSLKLTKNGVFSNQNKLIGGDTQTKFSQDVNLNSNNIQGVNQISTTSVNAGQIDNDDYHEKVVSKSGSTGDLDLSSANLFKQVVTGNISFSFNNAASSPSGNSFTLIVQQDSTGGHSISWPSSVEWGGGSAPNLSTNPDDKHMLSFISLDGGTTWIGIEGPRGIV